MSENFASIRGAEIFASGSWNGLSFTDDDLDRIVRSFDALELAGKVPLKLGHDGPDVRDDPSTQFAMGWVKKIWRQGRKLMADLDVPDKVHDLIKQGYLKFVSVELLKNVKASNQEIPWVLDAVALLGSDPPAVGVLKDLQTMTMSRRATLSCSERVTFARADYTPPTNEGRKTMSGKEDGVQMAELLDKVQSLVLRVNALEDENGTLKREKAKFSQTEQRLKDMEAANQRRERDQRRAELKAEFDRAIENEEIVPAARERFMKAYSINDDDVVMNVTIEDAKEFIRENPNPLPKRKPQKTQFSMDRPDADVPAGTPPDVEAFMRSRALLKQENIHNPSWEQLLDAAKRIFKANPSLGERYKFIPDQVAREARSN